MKYKKGLTSLIIPTIGRSKLTSIKTLLKKLYLLKHCIDDIKKNVKADYEIIVICNSTTDKKLLQFIQNSDDITRYTVMSENVGVPRAWNIGTQMAMGEYLCFVNDDVEIGPGAVETMIDALQGENVGEVGPNGGKWHRKKPKARVGIDKIEEADEISGWLFMTKRSVFEEVGGFDLEYTPALCEEIDFSFAVRNAGYKCLVVPKLDATHHHISGASSTNKPIKAMGIEISRDDLTNRNQSYFEKKWEKFW